MATYKCAKRPLEENMLTEEGLTKIKKTNSLQELNNRYPKTEYTFTSEGPIHDPTFTVSVVIDGREFVGTGASKQKAKYDLAVRALEFLESTKRHHKDIENCVVLETKKSNNFSGDVMNSESFDFTSDTMPSNDQQPSPLTLPSEYQWKSQLIHGGDQLFRLHSPFLTDSFQEAVTNSQSAVNRSKINVEKARLYPVMLLCELFPAMKINWSEGVGRGDRQFKVEVVIEGKTFLGEGRSKRMAKLNLAKTVLSCMYGITDFKDSETSKSKPEETQLTKKFPLTQLKELVGETLAVDVVQHEIEGEEKEFHATIVAKGVAYEAVGKNKNLAKLRAAKKALEIIRPKKDVPNIGETVEFIPRSTKKEIDVSRHPTMVFYEHYRGLQIIESESKTHTGVTEYHMEVEVEGEVFKSTALSKKKAKLRLVLQVFEKLHMIEMNSWKGIDVKDVIADKQVNNPATNHPIVLLLKLNPHTLFNVTEDFSCDSITTKFKAIARVGDKEFTGDGPNKKTAKATAARQALTMLYGIDPDNYTEETRTDYFTDPEPKHEISSELSDIVLDVVQAKCEEVFQGDTQHKVLAAFVLAKYVDTNSTPEFEVVSLGTGTKCVAGGQIDHKGQTVNDSHGEVIACRGFRQFLFDQLISILETKETTIFEVTSNNKYALKSNLKVFLYINTAPCGDGRIFTFQPQQLIVKNKTAGLLRTKIENGQGTIPVPGNNVQTSDGILEGERLRTMSCSDKILRWNALGVQGALLSHLLEPIYLEGIVVNLHYNYQALHRALYKRAGKMKNVAQSYKLNRPRLGSPSKSDVVRDTSKASNNSFNWYMGQQNVEAINATTGRTVVLTPSRLCKLNFFDKFIKVLKLTKHNHASPETYHAAKMLAEDYRKAKAAFLVALHEANCGQWVGKPFEHDMFGY